MLLSVFSITVTSRKLMDVEEVSWVNLMVECMWLSVVMKSVSLSCPSVQIKKMSSIKRHHTRGLYSAFSRAVASREPINMFAYGGAILVPMAVPCFCRKNCP